MAADRRCPHCASPNPGAHYGAFPCPGDATLRPVPEAPKPVDRLAEYRALRWELEAYGLMRRGKR